ncbi:TadE/TadG family type IV pilus assembly protein [Mesorhizobium sp. M7A.F.Ca.MR.362.00.0.0]|uniref:TadE/TadG family type IV pilus assembly protein n=1 Tax=Mesorhizobium sp. M7A.F.Ca.MR.362.00.0.0 TaxID=2496779 RepID=UPI000FD3484B|nr:TadE/TadG family type IV pilus assembly protein [Mesorhizobium sp. M7A.F.Ca.MR.362.00.0.0]RUU80297.1 VWA domain-containing protein [Mesorhizobium sp. M7A.F.Ca.MR.362.00.0.0]RWN97938.1 MAG: VWA domain-containing protein [Mesorhizobium sp.]
MRNYGGLVHAVGGFARDRGGNFAVLFGLSASVLALAAGFSVNVSQLYNARSSLQSVVDAAVTSTARDLTTGATNEADADTSVQAFLDANSQAGILQADQIVLDRLIVDRTAKTVQADAHVDVALYFPIFGTGDMKRVTASTTALYSDKTVEVAMMLDVTKSMVKRGKVDKIGDLKAAAKNAVLTMLQKQDPQNPRIRVAIVPYASGVNAGKLAENIYAEKQGSSELPPVAGSPLLVAKTGKNLLPSFSDYISIVGAAMPRPDNCATERKDKNGNADMSADGPDTVRTDRNGKKYYALVNRDDHLGGGMNRCPGAEVIPLTADSDALLESIEDFQSDGYTAGAIAIQWTYYMLSPQWRTAIRNAGLGKGASDADPKKIAKVAILMTDGQFNTAFAGAGDRYNSQGNLARGNAETLCENMKNDGIEIFTIGFDLDDKDMSATERDQAKAVLKDCSSKDTSAAKRHFFDVSTGAELDDAFQEIIRNTEKVALTQ